MLFKALLILMLSGTSSLYLLNFHGTRVDRKGLLLTFMCLEIFEKLFLDLVRCSTFTSLPRIDVCGWQNFWKLDTLVESGFNAFDKVFRTDTICNVYNLKTLNWLIKL